MTANVPVEAIAKWPPPLPMSHCQRSRSSRRDRFGALVDAARHHRDARRFERRAIATCSSRRPRRSRRARRSLSRAKRDDRGGRFVGLKLPRKRPLTASSSRANRDTSSARCAIGATGTAAVMHGMILMRGWARCGFQRALHRRDHFVKRGHLQIFASRHSAVRGALCGCGRGKSRILVHCLNGAGIRRSHPSRENGRSINAPIRPRIRIVRG